jgi:hypothetical protein
VGGVHQIDFTGWLTVQPDPWRAGLESAKVAIGAAITAEGEPQLTASGGTCKRDLQITADTYPERAAARFVDDEDALKQIGQDNN